MYPKHAAPRDTTGDAPPRVRRGRTAPLLVASATMAIVAAGCAAGHPSPRQAPRRAPPHVEYELRDASPRSGATGPAYWYVTIRITGVDPKAGAIQARLSPWGGWTTDPWPYIEVTHSSPAVVHTDRRRGRFRLATPPGWDGTVRFQYRLRLTTLGGKAQRRRVLLPTRAPSYRFGYSWNTLATLRQGRLPLAATVHLTLRTNPGDDVVTGWAGRRRGRQEVRLRDYGNAPIAFGRPRFVRRTTAPVPLEVYQFGRGADITGTLLDVLGRVGPAFAALFGSPLPRPYRAFVTDNQRGGMGSHHGLRVSFRRGQDPQRARAPAFLHHVVHELCHHWVGLRLRAANRPLVWFHEGFNEYLSLWQAAASGLVARTFFAQRLLQMERWARREPTFGRLSFADPRVRWRDGNGPRERLAYFGGAVLAFAIDVELRAKGRPGLPQLIRDLSQPPGVYSLPDLRAWMEARGLGQRFQRSIVGRELPPVAALLARVGFTRGVIPTQLTYLGIRARRRGPMGMTVEALDPLGPATHAGLRVGDTILGYFPARQDAPRAKSRLTHYPLLLSRLVPGAETAFLDVRRGARQLRIHVRPRLIGGGHLAGWVPGPAHASDPFFRFRPARQR